jgi:hypothetical protein
MALGRKFQVRAISKVYGPIGAFLAEFFPSRIRYTSVSVPYHIGNGWGGGLPHRFSSQMSLMSASDY